VGNYATVCHLLLKITIMVCQVILMVGKLVVENYPLPFIKKKENSLANFFDNFTLWLGFDSSDKDVR
jgi:hypothetical protein